MKKIHDFIIKSPENTGLRLDRFLNSNFQSLSRSHIQHLISNGDVLVNHLKSKSSYRLKLKDHISCHISKPEPPLLEPQKIPLNIIYEDKSLLIINKPSGLVVHPGAGNREGTLVNGLLYHCKDLSGINGILRPGIVHRLDKNTSGLMVIAKDDETHFFLTKQFETRDIIRTYQTIVWGIPQPITGEIKTFMERSKKNRKKMGVSISKGKLAITLYKVIYELVYFSLLEIILKTGRTHQIRVHMQYFNHPVFGDPDYNGRNSQLHRLPSNLQKNGSSLLKSIGRQALHAKKLSFIHPKSNRRLTFETEMPMDMLNLIQNIRKVFL